jgi:thiol-disulfide isomerase/thioredoxin
MRASLFRLLVILCLCTGLVSLPQCGRKVKESGAAPEFTLKTLEGEEVSLASLKGKVVLLDFWATWCAPCRESIPHLVNLRKEFGEKGLVILGMSADKGEGDVVRRFVKSMDIPYPVVITPDEVLRSYGVTALPTTVFIDRKGRIREKTIGFNSRIGKQMAEKAEELTSEKP